jgi:hypothetical protein
VTIEQKIAALEIAESQAAKKGEYSRAIQLNALRLELMRQRQLEGLRRLAA